MSVDELKKIVEELKGASKMHGKKARLNCGRAWKLVISLLS